MALVASWNAASQFFHAAARRARARPRAVALGDRDRPLERLDLGSLALRSVAWDEARPGGSQVLAGRLRVAPGQREPRAAQERLDEARLERERLVVAGARLLGAP